MRHGTESTPHPSARQVLVVDDDPAIRHAITRLLELDGFAVTATGTVDDARRAAQTDRVDAVVLDLRLGNASGLDLLAWLRQQPRYVTTPVLILTGHTDLNEHEETRIRQHSAYVFYKPQPLSVLTEYVKRLTGVPPRRG
jgi:DNA-binding response OmpR family regulator